MTANWRTYGVRVGAMAIALSLRTDRSIERSEVGIFRPIEHVLIRNVLLSRTLNQYCKSSSVARTIDFTSVRLIIPSENDCAVWPELAISVSTSSNEPVTS